MDTTILLGDCLETLKTLEAGSVQTCVTSPPYYGLRDYGVEGQIGLEETPEAYVQKLVQVFREVRRVLTDDGTLWLNLGDSYARTAGDDSLKNSDSGFHTGRTGRNKELFKSGNNRPPAGMKAKDLIGIPWMVAFALRADGWYLRSDIIWAKPNPMPESVTDRPTKSHEYIFLLSKSAQYYYDAAAIAEPLAPASVVRLSEPNLENQAGSYTPSKGNGKMKAVKKQDQLGKRTYTGFNERWKAKNLQADGQTPNTFHVQRAEGLPDDTYTSRNKRDVWKIDEDEFMQFLQWKAEQSGKPDTWTITTKPYKEAHFATFPPEIPETCILAGSKDGDTVLDPFNGSGTTGAMAIKHHRNYIGCELNPAYIELTNRRFSGVQPVLFASVRP